MNIIILNNQQCGLFPGELYCLIRTLLLNKMLIQYEGNFTESKVFDLPGCACLANI